MRGATQTGIIDSDYRGVSIHAPHAGRATAGCMRAPADKVAIHAPYAGRDAKALEKEEEMKMFQSTRPVWGATGSSAIVSPPLSRFQSTRPGGGATQ